MQANPDVVVTAQDLVDRLTPGLAQGDLTEALAWMQQTWTSSQLVHLLREKTADARKIAALALGLIGDAAAVKPLAIALYDDDPLVCRLAEHSLWAIWFRLGKPRAVSMVKCGNTHLDHGNFSSAIEKFSQAIQEDPSFAEAYNQRAIAFYLSEQYERAIDDCRAALARMPQHFGAMAGMGHCYAHTGQWKQARHCYRLALAIHPRLEGVEASLAQIDQLLQDHPEPN